jgi:hypothetical protein
MSDSFRIAMIEALEPRIAPAAVVTFTDVDGDIVTIKTSKGTSDLLDIICTRPPVIAGSPNSHLDSIDFLVSEQSIAEFAGTNIAITVKKKGGDGRVDVGSINGFASPTVGIDFGTITIQGSLGSIDAGDGNLATPSLRALTIDSLNNPNVESTIMGTSGTVTIRRDFTGRLAVNTLGKLSIGGDLKGTDGIAKSGFISAAEIKNVTIGGDVIGAVANDSGQLFADKSDSIMVKGDIVGGDGGFTTGALIVDAVQRATVRGSIIGGGGNGAGFLEMTCPNVTVGGDLRGGSGTFSGSMSLHGEDLVIKVGGDIEAGTGDSSGYLTANAAVKSLTILGNVDGKNSTNAQSGTVAVFQIAKLVFKGRMLGGGLIGTF